MRSPVADDYEIARAPVFGPLARRPGPAGSRSGTYAALIRDLRPTQFTVGFREVERKRQQVRDAEGDARTRLLQRLTFPVIVGPRGTFYVVDRHHWLRALAAEKVRAVEVTIMADLHRLGYRAFWAELERRGWCHPHDASGVRRSPAELPTTIARLQDDPFRSLASALRRATSLPKTSSLFSECKLANVLRAAIPSGLVESDFESALRLAIGLSYPPSAEFNELTGC